MSDEKCPKCGSERVSDHQIWWACDSCRFKDGFYQSSECKSQEITRLTAELAAANKRIAELEKQLSITHIPGKEDHDGEMQ